MITTLVTSVKSFNKKYIPQIGAKIKKRWRAQLFKKNVDSKDDNLAVANKQMSKLQWNWHSLLYTMQHTFVKHDNLIFQK